MTMENNNFVSVTPSPANQSVSQWESTDNTEIVEEGPRICPLCSSMIRLFFINFNEKILMCENDECEFPFGYEDVQIYKVRENDTESIQSGRFHNCDTESISSIDTAVIVSEINTMKRACRREPRNNLKRDLNSDEIQKNVNAIVGLNRELRDEKRSIIKNKKWISKLEYSETIFRKKMVHPEESAQLKDIKKKEEVTIDIGSNSDSMLTIKIEMSNVKTPERDATEELQRDQPEDQGKDQDQEEPSI